MPTTNTRQSGLEALIVNWLTTQNGYEQGASADYNREYAVDEVRLFRFLEDTQPEQMKKLGIYVGVENFQPLHETQKNVKRIQFLDRLRGEIAKRGVIDVLRNGIKAYPASLIMFYITPSKKNTKSPVFFAKNIFGVTRR